MENEVPNHKHFHVEIRSDDWMLVQNVRSIAFAVVAVFGIIFGCYTMQNHDWAKYGYHSTVHSEQHYNNYENR